MWVQIAGTAIAAYGAISQARASEKAAQYQAAVARNNQMIADQYAQSEIEKGKIEEQGKRMETAQRQSAIRAAVAGSGFDPTGETPLRLANDTGTLGELDALTIRNNAARAAYGYRVKGMNYMAEASLAEMRGKAAGEGGTLNAWSSVISGAAGVADKWSKWKTVAGNSSSGGGGSSSFYE